MRRWMALLMLMLFAAAAPGSVSRAAEDLISFTCPEQGYSTRVRPAWECEWVEGDGVYFHLEPDVNMPYVLAWMQSGNGRIRDGEAFLEEELPSLEEHYGQNGPVSVTRYGSFRLGSRPVSAAEIQYFNSQGLKIWFLFVIDVREDFTVLFRARYLSPDGKQDILDALEIIDGNLRRTGPSGAESSSGSHPAQAFTLTSITMGDETIGRCTAPAGWSVRGDAVCCTPAQSISHPWSLTVRATAPEGSFMGYTSARDYLHILRWDGGPQHRDGVYDSTTHTPLLRCMTAAEYCDFLAAATAPAGRKLTLVEENTFPEVQGQLREKERTLLTLGNASAALAGMQIEDVSVSLCSRRYALTLDGKPHYICVLCGVEAVRLSVEVPGIYVSIGKRFTSWKVPFNYLMVCPAESWDACSAAFDVFAGNTTASDEFNRANERLGQELWSIVNSRETMASGTSLSEEVLRREAASGDDYEEERYSDYLFDQNDYTLSDGRHVKVSTAYDYVYEGDNGMIYYSSSPDAQPGGSVRLEANR